jgi:hypothetical protein
MADLDSILSGESASAPAPERETAPSPQPETQSEQPSAERDPSSNDDPQPDERGTVPIAALHAERQKAKRYTEQVAEFQQQIREQREQFEQRFAQLQSALQPRQAQPEQPPAPEIWDDPNAFVQQNVAQALEPHLKQFTQAIDANSRLLAIQTHTPEAVEAAVKAFNEGAAARSMTPDEFHAVRNAPNRYVAAVEWHKRTQALREIGSDPDGYRAKLEAEILAKHGLSADGRPAAGSPQPGHAMPSDFAAARNVGNRSGPAWSGPQSLQDIFAQRK